jgi:hypothetical protein
MVGVFAEHFEWASVYDPTTHKWSDPLYFRENDHDTQGDFCAPGGLVERYLI